MNSLVEEKINDFFANYPTQKCSKNTILIQLGEEPDAIYKLDSGRALQYDISKDGAKIAVNVFKPPSFFPMSWAINGTNGGYVFEAHDDCTFRKAPARDVLEFIKREPDVMLDLLSRLYRGVNGLQRRMTYMATDNASKRLTFELIITLQRFGEAQADGFYAIPLSEPDLAINSGLSRETVNREIAKMKKQNLVVVRNKKLYLSSLMDLERYLEEV